MLYSFATQYRYNIERIISTIHKYKREESAMYEHIFSLCVNILSDYISVKIGNEIDKKKIESFKNRLNKKANELEKEYDGTIITNGDFYHYIQTDKVINKIFDYYYNPHGYKENEQIFIQNLKIKTRERLNLNSYTYRDKTAFNDFFAILCAESKAMIIDLVPLEQRGLLYEMSQTNKNYENIIYGINDINGTIHKEKERYHNDYNCKLTNDNFEHYFDWVSSYV